MAEGGVSEDMAERLTPTEDSPQSRRSQAAPISSCDNEVSFDGATFDCKVQTDNFVVHFDSAHVGTMAGNDSEFVTMIVESLERAREVFDEDGFRIPGRLSVFLSPRMPSNTGLALPSMPVHFGLWRTPPVIIMSSDYEAVEEYLPHHELFHQVQYRYISAERVALPVNNPYWWMEATAEWAAHRVQEMRDDFDHTEQYASWLRAFLDGPHLPFSRGALLPSGGSEYGAFVIPKFLEEIYDGADAVEFSWRKVEGWPFGTSPAGAVRSTVEYYGDSYSDVIHLFREWTYVLGRAQGKTVGFAHDDAQLPGFWRDWVAQDYRPPHQSVVLNSDARTASGVAQLAPSGAAYLEISGDAELTGDVEIQVTGPSTVTKYSVVEGVDEFPHQCPDMPVLYSEPSDSTLLSDSPDVLTVPIGGQHCGKAVLVITNTLPLPKTDFAWTPYPELEFEWSLTYRPHGAVVESAPLSVGIHSHGGLGYRGVGMYHDDITPQPYLYEGWGVSDGDAHGGVFGALHSSKNGDLEPVEITFTDNEAEVVTATGDLQVTHRVRPSGQDDLYAIDVMVERTGAPSTNSVTYRRTMDWSFGAFTYLTWELAPGGDDSRVALLTDAYSNGDPWSPAGTYQWPGYVDRVGPWVLGATIDLHLGAVAANSPVTFTLYYGISADTDDARSALAGVGADVISLHESSSPSNETVGVFGYRANPAPAP